MTRWWWVRHGPTHQKAFTGWRDVPADLSDTARVGRLKAYLPEDAIVVSSDLVRSIATADAIHKSGMRLPHAPDLREFNFGAWDGLHFKEVADQDATLSREFWENPGDVAPPGGESWNAVAARVARFVDRINSDYPDRDIVAVAHIGVILTQVQIASRSSAYEALSHTIDNLSVTRTTWTGSAWELGPINHLP